MATKKLKKSIKSARSTSKKSSVSASKVHPLHKEVHPMLSWTVLLGFSVVTVALIMMMSNGLK